MAKRPPKTVTNQDVADALQMLQSAVSSINQVLTNPPSAGQLVPQNDPSVYALSEAQEAIYGAQSDLGGRPCGGGRPC